MDKLNKDELFIISRYLNLRHLSNVSQSCKYINNIFNRDEIWFYQLEKDFPDFRNLNVDVKMKERYKLLYSLSIIKKELQIKQSIFII